MPYPDRSKVLAGVLQLVSPFGVGRFYTGHHGIVVAQLMLTLVVIGAIWSFVDGIVLLPGPPTRTAARCAREFRPCARRNGWSGPARVRRGGGPPGARP